MLAPDPRGSQLTMSYSRSSFFGQNPINAGSCAVPAPPGPPGLKKITPRLAGPVAGCSTSASLIFGPDGSR